MKRAPFNCSGLDSTHAGSMFLPEGYVVPTLDVADYEVGVRSPEIVPGQYGVRILGKVATNTLPETAPLSTDTPAKTAV